jgi:hypothetical protein
MAWHSVVWHRKETADSRQQTADIRQDRFAMATRRCGRKVPSVSMYRAYTNQM